MSLGDKTVLLRNPWKGETLRINRPAAIKAASLGTHFALGFVTGCVRVFGSCAPFGVAMAARSGGALGGLACVLGAAAGYLVSGSLAWALRYMAALVLVFTTAFLLRETAIAHRAWFMPAVAAAVMGATGALNAFDKLLQLSVAVDLATEVVLTGLSAYLFHMALTAERLRLEREELRREAGGVLILCCVLMALARVTIMDVLCLGRAAAVLCVMISSFGAGAAEGALIGVITGLSMDLASPATPIFTICYGFAGLMSGVLKRQGRLVFLLTFLAANTLAVFWHWDTNPCLPALYEAFCASVIFFVLPAKTMTFIVSMVQRPALGEGERGMRRYTAGQMRALADAFRELYETVRRSVESKENDADIATVYDRAAEEICAHCPRKEKCWQENYMDTLTLLNDATAAMRRRGHLELADLPARFREQCKSSAPFTAAVNSELRALIYRRQLRSRLRENRMAAYGQYRYCLLYTSPSPRD